MSLQIHSLGSISQCYSAILQLLSFTTTSSVFETCRHEILKGTLRLISSLTKHLCAIIDSRLLMCEWQYTKRDPNMKYLSQGFARAPIVWFAWFATTHLHLRREHICGYIWLWVTHDGLVREYLNGCESLLINPFMVCQGMDESYIYVPIYIDASWPNPIPCCSPHESKKPIAAHSYAAILHEISLPKAFCCLFHCQAYGAGIGAILHRDRRDDMMYLVMESFPKMTSHMVDGVLAPW